VIRIAFMFLLVCGACTPSETAPVPIDPNGTPGTYYHCGWWSDGGVCGTRQP
jgi:hypothetical protein